MANHNYHRAVAIKDDEWYTNLSDIENEVKHYWDQLEGKKIWCNCDDPVWSKFHTYFENQKYYHNFEIKYTGYDLIPSDKTGYTKKDLVKPMTKRNKHGAVQTYDYCYVDADGYCKGDFRAKEQEKLWEWADVIITNPPFSDGKFIELIELIMKYQKKFLVIGSVGALGYTKIYPLLNSQQIRTGYNSVSHFTKLNLKQKGSPCVWFTNLDVNMTSRTLILSEWEEGKFPKYVNYDAYDTTAFYGIPKKREAEIPFTKKILGVPITWLRKINPQQFKIVGAWPGHYQPTVYNKCIHLSSNTNNTNCKGAVYIKVAKEHARYQNVENGDYYAALYSRIFIQLTDEFYEKHKKDYKNETKD